MTYPSSVEVRSSARANASLAFSIVSLLLPYVWFLLAILAIVLGSSARQEIAQSNGRLTGDSRAKAGMIIGWVSLVAGLIVTIVLHIAVF